MARYRFFGSETTLPGNITLSTYGQTVEMEPEVANARIAADPTALIIPEELWDEIFVPGPETDAELAKWPSVTMHATVPPAATNAPPEFLAKTAAVRAVHHKLREDLKAAPKTAAQAAPESDRAVETDSKR